MKTEKIKMGERGIQSAERVVLYLVISRVIHKDASMAHLSFRALTVGRSEVHFASCTIPTLTQKRSWFGYFGSTNS